MENQAQTLAQIFEQRARQHGSRVFLRDKFDKSWRDHSWNHLVERTARLRAGLCRLGIKPGDRVAIFCDNSPEWVIVDQAALGLGAVVVPLYTTSGVEETRHVISNSGAKLVAANGAEHIEKLRALSESLPQMTGMIAMHRGAVPEPARNRSPAVMTIASVSEEEPAGISE